MKRIATGWRLAKDSWAVLRADRSLAIFPLLSTMFAALAVVLIVAPGLIGSEAADQDWIALPFLVVGGYVATFFVVYFNVALAGAARLSMDGQDTKVADGLAIARERCGLGPGPVRRRPADQGDRERPGRVGRRRPGGPRRVGPAERGMVRLLVLRDPPAGARGARPRRRHEALGEAHP